MHSYDVLGVLYVSCEIHEPWFRVQANMAILVKMHLKLRKSSSLLSYTIHEN